MAAVTLESSQQLPSSSASHRLGTVSATHALRNRKTPARESLSTGLPRVDALLQGQNAQVGSTDNATGGVQTGQVVEIYGSPGAGKTAFALHVCKSAIQTGGQVVWLSNGQTLPGHRLKELLSSHDNANGTEEQHSNLGGALQRFRHYAIPTMAHLFAFMASTGTAFPPDGTSLLVVDDISTLFDLTYPRGSEGRTRTPSGQWASGRKLAVMSDLMARLGRLAAQRNIAVIITSQTTTRIKAASGALLAPAMSATEWDNGVSSRLVVYRDWPPAPEEPLTQGEAIPNTVRFVSVLKANGSTMPETGAEQARNVVPFEIGEKGLKEVNLAPAELGVRAVPSPVKTRKRRFDEVADSEADSDESEYGWGDEDGFEEVAAEGLLIDHSDAPLLDVPDSLAAPEPLAQT